MTITKLIVGGFKSLRDTVEIPLAPITLMFGPNSVGKSVVRDALAELRHILMTRHSTDRCWEQSSVSGPRGHWLPQADPDEEPSYSRLVLGCEVASFNGELNLNEQVDFSTARGVGQLMQESLVGQAVGYCIAGTDELSISSLRMWADGMTILDYSVDSSAEGAEQNLVTIGPNDMGRRFPRASGWLRLYLGHAVWSYPGFGELTVALREALAQSRSADLDSLVRWRDDILEIGQMTKFGYAGSFESWGGTNFKVQALPAELLNVNATIDSLYQLINEFVFQVAHGLSLAIDMAHVPGSRSLLSEEDASTEWIPTDDFASQAASPTSVRAYAHWLALIKAQPKQVKPESLQAALQRDDFVNDVLDKHFFGARRYRVVPAVELRTETMLLRRGSSDLGCPHHEIQTKLYLQDGQGRSLDFSSVGSGISYVLPVLTALWAGRRSLIEQPELHLHPAAQCEMGDVIVRAFNRGRFSIIETHSEHLLLRVLRRIRETSEGKVQDRELQCQPEAVAVLYFSPQQDGSAQVHQLRVTRGGDFMDRWPDGFFEERSRELFDE